MPAVNPTRLSFQIADLIKSFHTPHDFHKKIKDLFSLYANRTLRYGDRLALPPLMPTYHLPDPVMRQLKTELVPILSEKPKAGLALADTLWEDDAYEVRLVAIFILGHAAVDSPDPILSRLNQWLSPDLDPNLKEAILHSGTQGLQSRFPDRWEAWIGPLMAHKNPQFIALGLIGLRSGLQSSPYQKLPVIYRLISPIVRNPQPAVTNQLKRLIEVLAQQSPTETAYFLRQALSLSDTHKTGRLIRQCLPMFPDDLQKELQEVLKTQSSN